jgi:hypothetical protein
MIIEAGRSTCMYGIDISAISEGVRIAHLEPSFFYMVHLRGLELVHLWSSYYLTG